MAGRRTNLALLVLLAGASATGLLAYAIGTGWARAAVVAHATLGLGIVVLAPWKAVIARRGLRRARPGRSASVVFSVLIAVAIVAGALHATGILVRVGPVTAMQVHVGAALASLPFAVWHVLARRVRVRRTDLSRRALLRAGAVLGAGVAAWAGLEGIVRLASLPGAGRRFTGSYEQGSFRPDEMPVTQWLNDPVPRLDAAGWRLEVVTAAGTRTLTYDEVSRFDDRVRATLDCTGGWHAQQEWSGVRLSTLVGHPGEARSVLVRSVTGYPRRFPVEDLDALLLATRAAGRPLSAGHGFPARIVSPGRRGFWWVKWVSRIELSERPWWLQWPFPAS